jgi:PASTA domain-containing protein
MIRRIVSITIAVALVFFGGGILVGRSLTERGRQTGSAPSASYTSTPSAATVPNMAGLPLSAAVQVLASVHLRVGTLEAREDVHLRGFVLGQEIAAGTRAFPGTEVGLVLSAGPRPQPVAIGDRRRVFVGGTCELMAPAGKTCIGGPLLVDLVTG